MKTLLRLVFRLFSKLAWWQRLAVIAVTPLLALNLTVAFVGHSAISPISPFFLGEKWSALKPTRGTGRGVCSPVTTTSTRSPKKPSAPPGCPGA